MSRSIHKMKYLTTSPCLLCTRFFRFRKAKVVGKGPYLCMERFISVPYKILEILLFYERFGVLIIGQQAFLSTVIWACLFCLCLWCSHCMLLPFDFF